MEQIEVLDERGIILDRSLIEVDDHFLRHTKLCPIVGYPTELHKLTGNIQLLDCWLTNIDQIFLTHKVGVDGLSNKPEFPLAQVTGRGRE